MNTLLDFETFRKELLEYKRLLEVNDMDHYWGPNEERTLSIVLPLLQQRVTA